MCFVIIVIILAYLVIRPHLPHVTIVTLHVHENDVFVPTPLGSGFVCAIALPG